MPGKNVAYCTVCGGQEFSYREVLWRALVDEWQLSPYETDYINRQQGFVCEQCGNNLRSMALAGGIVYAQSFTGNLVQFAESSEGATLKILEINEAGGLTPIINKLPGHLLIRYPEYDMTSLTFSPETFDLVIHSDTLEHVSNPERALAECRRVLCRDGKCIFTVPIIVDRMTRSRTGLSPSYHGQSGVPADDQVVFTEFGADIWELVLKAGFSSCEIFSLEYPAALAIVARK